jgi:hypothetical protein
MKDTIYLRFDRTGVNGMTKRPPALGAGELAVKIQVKVADGYFRQITPEATLEIDERFVIEPVVEVEPQQPPAGVVELAPADTIRG